MLAGNNTQAVSCTKKSVGKQFARPRDEQAIEDFVDAMAEQDIRVNPADIIADGKLHRIHADGDGRNTKDGWYVLHADDKPAGKFGHNGKYGYDVAFTWSMKVERAPMSAEEKRAWREKMDADRARREAEEAARHAAAAELANRIWDAAAPIAGDDHPYLQRKGVQSYGLRVGRWEKIDTQTGEVSLISDNALLVPIWAPGKKIHSLQAILPDAKKLGRDKDYLSGANKHGHYFSIGKPLEHEGKAVILLCEGYGTGASLHAATGHAVIVAFDAPNLLPVAELMRSSYPDATIIVCADNDQWTLKPVKNPGLTRANEVRDAVGALVALPQFDESLGVEYAPGKRKGPSDFNDLANLEGADAVRRVIADTLNPPVVVDPIAEAPAADIPPWEDVPSAAAVAVLEAPADDMNETVELDEDEKPSTKPKGETIDHPSDNPYFRLLGYYKDKYYILPSESKQVRVLTKADFNENGLLELAHLNWWELHFPNGKQGGINKRAAVNFLVRASRAEGIYDDSRRRGRGAWEDNGRIVFHVGSHLLVDGVRVEVTNFDSRFVYELDKSLPDLGGESATDEEARWVIDTAKIFRWDRPASALLAAGWAALAPICGAIEWRPHIWLTGGAGCGKSTILGKFLAPLTSGAGRGERGMCILAQGNTSEAGIRQRLRTDALPVLFDESESNRERDADRIQSVLSLIRQASTESDFETLKGTAGGEAMSFHIRSMFALASIQTALVQQADIERLTVLRLRDKRDNRAGDASWGDIEAELSHLKGNSEFSRRLINRSLRLLPVTLKNIRTFVKAATRKFGTAREGDQYGALLAGAWSLASSDLATDGDADELINSLEWTTYVAPEADDRYDGINALMRCVVKTNGYRDATLGELVQIAGGEAIEGLRDVEVKEAERILGRHGLRRGHEHLYIATTNETRASLLAKTSFNADLRGSILRVPGAEMKTGTKRFAGLPKPSGFYQMPLAAIFDVEEESDELEGERF